MSQGFAARLRSRERMVGYWMSSDNPAAIERIAGVGYDYVLLDGQHGLFDRSGLLKGLLAVDAGAAAAGTGTSGVVRVEDGGSATIGWALDAGAAGVLVPLVDGVGDAERCVSASRYPPVGTRSFGPVRAALRFGPAPREVDAAVACVVMIETRSGLEHAEAICAVDGLDAVYVGPSDLGLAMGGETPSARWDAPDFRSALARVLAAADRAGIGCGMHCMTGEEGRRRMQEGFTFVSISDDLTHLTDAARGHLAAALA